MENNAQIVDFSEIKDAIENGITPDASMLKLATEMNAVLDVLATSVATNGQLQQFEDYEPISGTVNDLTTEVSSDAFKKHFEAVAEEEATAEDFGIDTDLMEVIQDMSERLAALEKRIEIFNVRSSHKI
jgi:hypothetical protein